MDESYEFKAGFPTTETAATAHADAALQRAVTAYRFWYPTVSVEGIFNGNRSVGIADNEGFGIASTGPRQVGFTLNSDTPYGVCVLDLADGPLVVELPPGPYIGLADDHHQRWILDMGIPGPDGGRGGIHVLLPPGWEGDERGLPEGAHVGRSNTYKVLLAIRALPLGGDLPRAMEALRAVRIHPLDQPDTAAQVIDTTERKLDSTCLRWEANIAFWERLHAIVDAEPVVREFRPMHGLLASLGIEQGKPFAPDAQTRALLERAARLGRDQLLVSAFASTRPDRVAWPDRQWEWAGLVPHNADFETPAGLDLEARDRWFAQAIVASPAMFRRKEGVGSLYWLAARDADGAWLDGGRSYTLTVPLPVPARLFWSLTVYDAQTRSQVATAQDKAALRSLFELADAPTEGSIDLHVGPEPPHGAEDRWLQTTPGRGWFAYIRLYGPGASAFDGSWKPADFTPDDAEHGR